MTILEVPITKELVLRAIAGRRGLSLHPNPDRDEVLFSVGPAETARHEIWCGPEEASALALMASAQRAR